jgi:SET domain-containing protein
MKKTSSLVVKRGTHGLGLFTTEAIAKGAFVIEYTGEKITTEEANRRGGQYLFEVNDNYTVDGRGRENTARYINHSCRPNCYPEIDDTEEHIYIYAKRAIKPGEELTYDYGKEFWNMYIKPKQCRCDKCTEKRQDA